MTDKDFKNSIHLKNREIGANFPPYVVAEMSGNHNQSLTRALSLVDAAAEAGVDALKIQTYTADTMTIDSEAKDFLIQDEASLWKGEKLYDLYRKAFTPWEWHAAIFKRCEERGIAAFSTPFDETALEFLESLNAPFYKIASFENTDLPLIRAVAKTKKPMIISTGMMTQDELDQTVACVKDAGCRELILLKCTSAYPADPREANLAAIPLIKSRYGCEVGISDHTMGIGLAVASVALGGIFIEKHFTLNRKDGGVDSAFSLEPAEMQSLVHETRKAWLALGKAEIKPSAIEKKSLQFRRSLYATRDIAAGETLTSDNVKRIRPGYGLAPKNYELVLGKKASQAIKKGTPLSWELLEKEGL